MNDDIITILSYLIHIISYHPARAITAGYAAEKDSEWKKPYIIYAGNAKPPGKIIRKKLKKVLTLNGVTLYNTVVSRLRETNPKPGTRNLKISS